MKNLVIFKTSNDDTSKDLLYESFESNNSDLSQYHYKSFNDMYKQDTLITTESNIPSILISNIIDYVIPIIDTINVYKYGMDINDNKKKENIVFIKKEEYGKLDKIYKYTIKTNINKNIKCLFNKNEVIVPANTDMSIIGLKISKYLLYRMTLNMDYILNMSNDSIIEYRKYSIMVFNLYLQSLFSKYKIANEDYILYFESESDSLIKIRKLITLIKYINNSYASNFLIFLDYIKVYQIDKPLIEYEKDKYKEKEKEKNYKSSKTIIIEILGILLNNNKLSIYDLNNSLYIMNKYDILDTYHKIDIMGINNPYSKVLLDNVIKKTLSMKKSIIHKKVNIVKNNKYEDLANNIINAISDNPMILPTKNSSDSYLLLKKYIKTLKEISPKLDTDYIKDKNGITIICQHYIHNALFLIDNKKNVKDLINMRQTLINKFSLPLKDDGYFCKICGMLLSTNDDTDNFDKNSQKSSVSYSVIDDILYRETSYVLTRYTIFKYIPDYKKLINNINSTIYNKINDIFITISKNKLSMSDSVIDIITLHIDIYIIAVIINMIYNNYGQMTFSIKSEKSESPYIEKEEKIKIKKTGGKKSSNIINNILSSGLKLLLNIKYLLISKLNSINTDYIKNTLIQAYTWVSSLQTEQIIDIAENDENYMFNNSYIYNYLNWIYLLNKPPYEQSDINKINKQTFSEFIQKYNTPIDKLLKKDFNIDKFKSNKIDLLINYINIPDKPGQLSDNKYNIFLNFINSKPIKLPVYVRPLNFVPINTTYKKNKPFNTNEINLIKYYDIKGNKHTFDKYIYQQYNNKNIIHGKKIEYTKKEILDLINSSDKFNKLIIVGKKCSLCSYISSDKISSSSVNKTNKIILNKLKEKDIIDTIWLFYENICPKGDLHTYNNTGDKCIKCGKTDNKIEFYKKYNSIYVKYISINDKLLSNIFTIKKPIIIKTNKSKWVYTLNYIKKLSTTFNINYNVWSNLGSSYMYSFDLIKNKKINPINNITSINDINYRCYIVLGYINKLPNLFKMIIYHNVIIKIPYTLKTLLNKINVSNLNKSLSNKYNIEFNEHNEEIFDTPENKYNFLLNKLSFILLKFYEDLQKNKVSIADDILLYVINTIIKYEQTFSLIDEFKYKTTLAIIDNLIEVENIKEESDDDEDKSYSNDEESSDEDKDENFKLDIEDEDPEDDSNNVAEF